MINYVSKRPQRQAKRRLELQVGNDDFLAGSFEATGPLAGSDRMRYRFGVYQDHENPFRFHTGSENRLADALERAAASREEAAPELLAGDLRQLFGDTLYGIDQIAELVSGLKDFARLDRAMSEEVDLNECIRSALLIARNNIKDKAEVSQMLGELPRITCAPSQINQVLLNLFTNAAQAMDEPGRIQIRSWADEAGVFISVQDSGRGMPPEVMRRIFDPFFTTKPVGEGTGLGLSISYKIIRDHGGSIRVASEPGRGTRFLISLPRNPAVELKRSA